MVIKYSVKQHVQMKLQFIHYVSRETINQLITLDCFANIY